MTVHKILKYLALVIGVIGLILLGRILMAGDESIAGSADVQASVVDPFMFVAYLVFAIIVLLVLFFVVKGLFRGNIKNTLISVGIFIAIIAIAYVLADGNAVYDRNETLVLDESGSRWVGTGLITFYILAATAILLMVISGIRKLVK